MLERFVGRVLVLVLGITAFCTSAWANPKCLGPNDPIACIKYQGQTENNFCGNGVGLWEVKFVCQPGTPRAGQGWDIWCRTTDGKCNVHKSDACPNSGQLTQWTVSDHCTQQGAPNNWTPPPDDSKKSKKERNEPKKIDGKP